VSRLEVDSLGREQYAQWSALLARSPAGSIYAEPAYLAALTHATGASFRILGVSRAGELLGGVALYETSSTLGGRRAGPRLLLYYHGPVLAPYAGGYPSEQTARDIEILDQLAMALEAQGYDEIVLKSPAALGDIRPFQARGWYSWPAYSYVVPLTDLDAQWHRVESNLRRLIKRCDERDGVRFSDDSDFDAFFRLHALTLGRRGTATYLPEGPFRVFFKSLHAAGMMRLFHARLPDGTAIASQLVLLGSHPVSHTVCAGMDPAYGRLGASAFLRWRAFQELARLGYRGNDLTDAALNQVTHFKAQLGGTLECALVVEAPRSMRARSGRAITVGATRARRLAGALVRRLVPRRGP